MSEFSRDFENDSFLTAPYIFIEDCAMINSHVFRNSSQRQFSAVNEETFAPCLEYIIDCKKNAPGASNTSSTNEPSFIFREMEEQQGKLYKVSRVRSLTETPHGCAALCLGYIRPEIVSRYLPKTYDLFERVRKQLLQSELAMAMHLP